MTSSCRLPTINIIKPEKNPHIGLWLDKGFGGFKLNNNGWRKKNKDTAAVNLLKKSVEVKNTEYENFFNDWKKLIESFSKNATFTEHFKAETTDRLIVGLGTASVWENAISIHRTYGVPYIPGSALKGLASSYAHQRLEGWEKGGHAHKVLFGDETSAGYITFWDALPLPDQWQLHREVITPHHRDYYQGKKNTPPADWDNPVPVPFITASGSFQFFVSGQKDSEKWIQKAKEILIAALAEFGVGGKTSSGYGYFETSP